MESLEDKHEHGQCLQRHAFLKDMHLKRACKKSIVCKWEKHWSLEACVLSRTINLIVTQSPGMLKSNSSLCLSHFHEMVLCVCFM